MLCDSNPCSDCRCARCAARLRLQLASIRLEEELLEASAQAFKPIARQRRPNARYCAQNRVAIISAIPLEQDDWPMSESDRLEELRRDEQCLERIRLGGSARTEGISQLYRRYAKRFVSYLAKHRVPREHAEDLVQDVFISVVRKCEDFRGDTRIDAWLWAIVRNHLIDYFRRAKPEVTVDDEDLIVLAGGAPDPEYGASLDDCVKAAFAQFAQKYRDRAEIMAKVTFDGWGIAEVAAVLQRNPGATREYVSQCRKKMREFLEPCRQYLAAD